MKKLFLFLCISAIAVTCAAGGTIPLREPVVPNVIHDKFIAAEDEHLEGLLAERMNINLEKRLLKIDSAILLSGFRQRPG
jgi:hypothetical protein